MSADPEDGVIIARAADVPGRTEDHAPFGFEKRVVVPKAGNAVQVSFMEIPPGRSAFPYHWHATVVETYVMLSGRGVLRSPSGEREVGPGDVVVMPAGPGGAHRLHNPSDTEPLRYVDIDTVAVPDVIRYPDSSKTAIIDAAGSFRMLRDTPDVDYYDGETGDLG